MICMRLTSTGPYGPLKSVLRSRVRARRPTWYAREPRTGSRGE